MSTFICLTKNMLFGNIALMTFLLRCPFTLLSFLREAFVCNNTKTTHNKIKIQESEQSKVRRVNGDARKSCFLNEENIQYYEYIDIGHGRPKKSRVCYVK